MLYARLNDKVCEIIEFEYDSQDNIEKGINNAKKGKLDEHQNMVLRELLKNNFWYQKTGENKHLKMLTKLVILKDDVKYEVPPYYYPMLEIL